MDSQRDKNDDHFAQDHIYSGNRKEPYIKAISYLVFGLFFVIAGIVNFLRIKNWEHTGARLEMNTATELMYKAGGKWLILTFMSVLGTVIIRKGYLLWRRIKIQEKI